MLTNDYKNESSVTTTVTQPKKPDVVKVYKTEHFNPDSLQSRSYQQVDNKSIAEEASKLLRESNLGKDKKNENSK